MNFYSGSKEHMPITLFGNTLRWKARAGKTCQEGASGLGVSIAGTAGGHGVRESKVVFRMH